MAKLSSLLYNHTCEVEMNLKKILTGDEPLTNTVRKIRWIMAWKEATGEYPKTGHYTVYECRICKKPVWIKSSLKVSPLDITCSADCFVELDELRYEKHWS